MALNFIPLYGDWSGRHKQNIGPTPAFKLFIHAFGLRKSIPGQWQYHRSKASGVAVLYYVFVFA